ncbi:uncharacterized protein LOC132697764 isoform X2 [Cylas formicarius]|uniref:uncharacterized protein LOC132697764 isoform X2 n=1 Tax=Cylas formicarius TaxID=197179 RepID=UPI0029587A94|nr:uncharacterized protein LOC132697764 isoform X2 [Cylas formicarius]
MYVSVALCLGVLSILLRQILSNPIPTPQNKTTFVYRPKFRPSSLQYESLETTTHQTETVHQIKAVEEKIEQTRNAYSKSLPNYEESKDNVMTLDELKQRCQHFSKLFEPTKESDSIIPYNSETAPGRIIGSTTLRPVYIRNKPTFIQKTNGFYVTVQPIGMKNGVHDFNAFANYKYQRSTEKPYPEVHSTPKLQPVTRSSPTTPPTISTTADGMAATPPKIKIKYTRLEPVILQKTILTDGRILYHWHKALPTAAFDVPVQETGTPIQPEPAPYEFPSFVAHKPSHETATERSTTSTTTSKSSWYLVPFGNLFGSSSEDETTTEQPRTPSTIINSASSSSPTSTTAASTPSTSPVSESITSTDEVQLEHQLKFVVPVHYDDIDHELNPQSKLWNFNRFAYYPKDLQPANVMPQPSFPLIKSLVVPKYSLGYTNGGYGLYGAGYNNYQGYTPSEKSLDNVSM